MDWKKEIKETIIYIIVGLVLANVINTGLGYALHTSKPVMAVVSNSMEPTFYKGDLVVVKGVDPNTIKVGDIIVYENPWRGIPVVHRVVGIEKVDGRIYFFTKGDNARTNRFSDQQSGIAPPVSEEMVKGKVIIVIPKLGWFKVLLTEFLRAI
jgi:signal peptidase